MRSMRVFMITAMLAAFGMLTLFMSSSVIFDMFDVRAHQGNYVLFVVWANFFSGILFLTAAFAFFRRRIWSYVPLVASVGILAIAFAGLMIHINGGGAYEAKTVAALIFRITVNVGLALILYTSGRRSEGDAFIKFRMIALLSLAALVASCGHRHGDEHGHDAVESEASHHHGGHGESLTLNKGVKWEADEHTLSVVEDMKLELSGFEESGERHYRALADSLTHQLDVLVAGCTMKGAAHDELHKWLVPFTESVKQLAARSGSDARVEVSEIKRNLDLFGEFFESKAD